MWTSLQPRNWYRWKRAAAMTTRNHHTPFWMRRRLKKSQFMGQREGEWNSSMYDVSKVNIKISCVISFCGMSEDLANQFEITCIYSGWGFIQFVGINFWWILWNLWFQGYVHSWTIALPLQFLGVFLTSVCIWLHQTTIFISIDGQQIFMKAQCQYRIQKKIYILNFSLSVLHMMLTILDMLLLAL